LEDKMKIKEKIVILMVAIMLSLIEFNLLASLVEMVRRG